MNLALPAVVIILGMLPGIVFFHSYFSGKFARVLAKISTTSELALYILFTIPLWALSVWLIGSIGYEPQHQLIARVLLGGNAEKTMDALGAFFRGHGIVSGILYLGILLLSLVLGNLCRRLVWATRLDLRVPFFRLKHEWFYTITGRLLNQPRGVVPSVDIMADRADGTALYQGVITHVEIGKDGNLEQLVLEGARRGRGRGEDFEWVEIPGDKFVVTGNCVHSINLRYVELTSTEVDHKKAKRLPMVRVFLRSFFFQEP